MPQGVSYIGCVDPDVGTIKGERDALADQSGAAISLSDHV